MRLQKLSDRPGCFMMIFIGLTFTLLLSTGALRAEGGSRSSAEPASPLAAALGVLFVEGSDSSLILERDGKQYVVDLVTRTIRETESQQAPPAPSAANARTGAAIFQQQCSSCHGNDGKGTAAAGTPNLTDSRARAGIPRQRIVETISNGKAGGTTMPSFAGRLSPDDINNVASYVQSLSGSAGAGAGAANIYVPADDFVYSLPTGRAVARKGLYINFTHRFAYNPAFSGRGLGNTLLGLDGIAVSSFGFRYGITDKLSASVYRSPSLIARPIEFMAAYNFVDESRGHPVNAAFRVSIDGQDNFRKNFTTNLEGIVSRSISGKAQLYGVPTLSLGNRRLLSKPGALETRPANLPGINSFSLGAGLLLNIRPTVALVAEGIPTLVHGRDLGILRPAYSFGIQKQVKGHAFTLGFSNGPGTVVAQRAGTRASYLKNPDADEPSGLFIGFNLMRRLH